MDACFPFPEVPFPPRKKISLPGRPFPSRPCRTRRSRWVCAGRVWKGWRVRAAAQLAACGAWSPARPRIAVGAHPNRSHAHARGCKTPDSHVLCKPPPQVTPNGCIDGGRFDTDHRRHGWRAPAPPAQVGLPTFYARGAPLVPYALTTMTLTTSSRARSARRWHKRLHGARQHRVRVQPRA